MTIIPEAHSFGPETDLSKIKLQEEPVLHLYECQGFGYPIQEFANKHLNILNDYEQEIVKKAFNVLPSTKDIPKLLKTPKTRSKWLSKNHSNSILVKRCGARSALWEEHKVIFKACRPVRQADFPSENLPFGAENITYSRISFGVLSAEGVMREILAFCFFKIHQLPIHRQPLCVYEYKKSGVLLGYALVLKIKTEERLEHYLEYPEYTISDLITAYVIRKQTGFRGILGHEVNLKGINKLWYVEKKSTILCDMHFYGGFRGLLNSNLGNDIIGFNNSRAEEFYVCDFDTFKVVQIPVELSRDFLKAFLLQCFIEVLKGSLPIIDCVDNGNEDDPAKTVEQVKNIYFKVSALWRSYKRKFDIKVKKLGWDEGLVSEIFFEVQETPAFITTILDCVPNTYTLKRSKKIEDSMYTPHN